MRSLQKQIIFLALLSLALLINAQDITLNHINQLNEVRMVDLSSSFGLVTDLFQVNPGTSSKPQLTQPLVTYESDNNPTSSRYVYSSSQIQIESQLAQEAQIYESLNSQGKIINLSLLLIDSSGEQTKISESINLDITKQFTILKNSDFEVSLYAQNKGVVLMTDRTYAKIFLFALDGASLKLSPLIDLLGTSKWIQALLSNIDNTIQFIVYSQSNNVNQIQLYSIQTDYTNLKVIQTLDTCRDGYASDSIINPLIYGIKCRYIYNQFNYELYPLNLQSNTLSRLVTTKYGQISTSYIKNIRAIQNNIYILELIQKNNQIQLVKMAPNLSTNSVEDSINIISILQLETTLFSPILINQHLITIITDKQVIGISIPESRKIFILPLQISQEYQPYQAKLYSNSLFVQYYRESDTFCVSQQLITNIPSLTYTQSTNDAYNYIVTVNNDVSKRKLMIQSTIGVLNQYTVQIYQNSQSYYVNMFYNQNTFTLSLDNSFSGSNLSPTIGKFTPEIQGQMNGQVQIAQEIQILYPSVDINTIQNIFGTNTNFLLIDSYDSQSKYRNANLYQIQSYKDEFTLQFISSTPINDPITNVDKSGFFSTIKNNFWIIKGYVQNTLTFQQIETDCPTTQSFQFSSNSKQNVVATICGTDLIIYTYSYNKDLKPQFNYKSTKINYPQDKLIGPVVAFDMRSSGQLRIASSSAIISVEVQGGFTRGLVTIPQSQQNGQIYLYDSSFLIVTSSANGFSISQYSYNNFNGSEATHLRDLMSFDYQWQITKDLKGIYQVTNGNFNSQSEEFLIVDAINTQSQLPFKLYYKISKVSSQNQFYTAIPVQQINFFFALPTYFGYLSTQNQKLQFYSINYQIKLQVSVNQETNSFYSMITSRYTLPVVVKGDNKYNIIFTFQRNVQADGGKIYFNDDNVIKMKNYFINNQISNGATIKFQDTGVYSSNYLGWAIPTALNTIFLEADIQQRISISQQSQQGYVDMIEIMPNTFMYVTLDSVYIQSELQTQSFTGRCALYKDDAATLNTSDDQQNSVQVTIYQMCFDKDANSSQLIKYIIKGQYSNFPNSPPETITVLPTQNYKLASNPFKQQDLVRIITDSKLGLIALLRQRYGFVSQVCQLDLSKQEQFSLGCTAFNTINNLQIVDIYWYSALKLVIYISQIDYAYFNFDDQNLNVMSIPIKSALVNSNQNLFANSLLVSALDLGNNGILISYDNNSIFIIQLQKNNDNIIINPDQTKILYQQPNYTFMASAFYQSSTNQIVLFFSNDLEPSKYSFLVYEQFQQKGNNYLINSSASINLTNGKELYYKSIKFFIYNNKLTAFLNLNPLQLSKPITITLNQFTTISVISWDKTKELKNQQGCLLTPIGATPSQDQSIGLYFNQISSKSVSFLGRLKYSLILMSIIILSLI